MQCTQTHCLYTVAVLEYWHLFSDIGYLNIISDWIDIEMYIFASELQDYKNPLTYLIRWSSCTVWESLGMSHVQIFCWEEVHIQTYEVNNYPYFSVLFMSEYCSHG